MERPETDRWGSFLSAYAPIRDRQGKCVGVAGIDVAANEYARRLASIRHAALPAVLLATLLSAVVGYQVFRLRRKTLQHEWQRELDLRAVRRACTCLESMLDNVPSVAVQGFDRLGTITHWNPASARVYGFPAEQAVGQRIQDLILAPSDTAEFEQALQQIWQTGRPTAVREWSIQTQSGGPKYVLSSMFPVTVDGEVAEVFCMDVDISERRRVEESLHERIRDLEAAGESLRAAVAAAERALRARSEFLANMSHEIRTPVTAIIGFAEILLGDDRSATSPVQDTDALRVIQRNGRHLLQLLDDILDLSKIEAGKLAVQRAPTSPVEIVADVLRLVRPQAEPKGLQLSVDWTTLVPEHIRTDALRLRQILINVVNNAVKFTLTGSVRLTVAYLQDDANAPRMRFEITDTGIGMTAEQLSSLFQPFQQADGAVANKFGGTGLGLAISRRLAALLDGDLEVQSVLGQGTTVRVTIAAGEPAAPLRRVASAAGRDTGSIRESSLMVPRLPGRILLAEDGPDNQRLVSLLLRNAGAEVTVAEDGCRAVELAVAAHEAGRPFEVILMDMQMPVMDGYEATVRLRALGMSDVPIIALTAHAQTGDREKCLAAGCDDYASKPIHRGSLFATIARHLHRNREHTAVTQLLD
jgi:PAS domain S-box-containing protein